MGTDSHDMMYQLVKGAIASHKEADAIHALFVALVALEGRADLRTSQQKDWWLALQQLAGSDLTKLKFPDGTANG